MTDKCICIKDFFIRTYLIYKKDVEYEYTNEKFINSHENVEGYCVQFSHKEYLFFSLQKSTLYETFSDHFKTAKEIRKEKLNKINNYDIRSNFKY